MNYDHLTAKQTKDILGCCTKTLQEWDKKGLIEVKRTAGGRRRYNVKKYAIDNNLPELIKEPEIRRNVIYSRVSSHDRKDDLERQTKLLQEKYPDYEVIQDIGSGINFKRRGLQKIIQYAVENQLNEIVITYKDRLCRIGYDMIEFIIKKYSNGNITILNPSDENRADEITKDLIEIITVYSSKIHGIRRNIPLTST
jgi:predicted site-specific integrase-resolvase